ncbi:MAG TPA: hypothetical protein VF494_01160 [Candidatus Limnocylindrales bacterium]
MAPTDRVPAPGPSFLREQGLVVRERRLRAGMSRPATSDDWWLAVLWVADDSGLVRFADLAPVAGPPPEPPAARLGLGLGGGLSGLILEDAGRLQIRVAPAVAPDDPDRPWRAPAIVRVGFRWEPARAATLRPNELATEVLTAFRRAAEALSHR